MRASRSSRGVTRAAPITSFSAVEVRGCLHLKSAVTAVADHVLLANRAWMVPGVFDSLDDPQPFEVIDVDPEEPRAANVARVGDRLLSAAAFPRTCDRLDVRKRALRSWPSMSAKSRKQKVR